ASRWIAAILVTATFAALLINQSRMMGALALPPVYDDVSYYVTGAEYLKSFYERGIIGPFEAYLSNPPHAPLSTALAFLGFCFLGIKPLAGPAANAICFLFFLRAFFAAAAPLPLGQTTLLSVALMGVPFVGSTIMEFRPDMLCSLLTAAGVLFIL